jgi:hypothetical protein
MAFLHDNVLDLGVDYVDDTGVNLYICSGAPSNYTEASSTLALGVKAGVTISAPQNGASNGRRVVISAITDGTVTATGTASHWALTDGSSILIAWQTLSSSQGVTNGNTFSLTAISITIPDPA